jgi:hypothetical protein
MGIQLGILLIPLTNLFNVDINLLLKHFVVLIRSVILHTLLLVTEVNGTFNSTGAGGLNGGVGQFECLLDFGVLFDEKVFVSESC